MAYMTILPIFVPNSKSFGPVKSGLWAKQVGELCIMLIWENRLVGIILPANMAASIQMYGDFLNFEQS